jgi:hypothetical protein
VEQAQPLDVALIAKYLDGHREVKLYEKIRRV